MRFDYDRHAIAALLGDVRIAGAALYPVVEGYFLDAGAPLWKADLVHRAQQRDGHGPADVRDPRSLLALVVNDEVIRAAFGTFVAPCAHLSAGLNAALHPGRLANASDTAADFAASRDHILRGCASAPWTGNAASAGVVPDVEVDALLQILDAVVCVAEAWAPALDTLMGRASDESRSARDVLRELSATYDFGLEVRSDANEVRRIANAALHPRIKGEPEMFLPGAAVRADELADQLVQTADTRCQAL